jgi:CHAT domain-containing protein
MHSYFLRKIHLLFAFLLLFTPVVALSQYSPYYSEARQVEQYTYFETYQQLIDGYNQNRDASSLRFKLDSLSQKAFKRGDFHQFLFLQNERSNFYKASNLFDEGFLELHNAMQSFLANADTVHLEYAVSLRMLRGLLTRSSQTGREEEELLQSQLSILYLLGQAGEPLTNTLVDYGLFLNRSGRVDSAIDTLLKARNSALVHGDLSSLALSDYTIISNLGSEYDLQQTTLDVLKTDLELFSAAPPSLPILIYSSYFNYLLGNKYADWYNDMENAVFYTQNAIACLDTLAYPTWNLKSSCHSNMTLFAAEMNDETLYQNHYQQAREIAANQPMSAYNQALSFINLAEASLTFAPDSALSLLAVFDSLPGAVSFSDHARMVKVKALLEKGEKEIAIRLIKEVFTCLPFTTHVNDELCETEMEIPYQIEFTSLYRNILQEKLKNEPGNVNLTDSVAALIKVESKLYTDILKKDVYGFETSPLGRQYREFLWPALDFLFTNNINNRYNEHLAGLIYASKAAQLTNTLAKMEAQKELEADTSQFVNLMSNMAQLQDIRNKIHQAEEIDVRNELKKKLNTLLVENLVEKNRMDVIQHENAIQKMPDIKELANALRPGEGLLDLLTSDSTLVFTYIDSDGIIMGKKEIPDLKKLVRDELYRLKTGAGESVMGDIIFEAVAEKLVSINHLTVIPDNDLASLAFEWMRIPTTGKMLVETHNVSYSYSLALWLRNRLRKDVNTDGHLLAVAPLFYNPDDPQPHQMQYASRYRGEASLYPLYSTLNEVETISTLMSEQPGGTITLTGIRATHESVTDHLKGASVIHFATHGLVNKDLPERSGLFLHPGNTLGLANTLSDDSFISLGELINAELDADLVVLSACSSGVGFIEQGEGVLALPRGFILAGVHQVVATLWNVNDEKTRDFMVSFYSWIKQGYSTAAALQLTKIEMIRSGYLPMDWAAFVLMEG